MYSKTANERMIKKALLFGVEKTRGRGEHRQKWTPIVIGEGDPQQEAGSIIERYGEFQIRFRWGFMIPDVWRRCDWASYETMDKARAGLNVGRTYLLNKKK